jgi:hypothetical protein
MECRAANLPWPIATTVEPRFVLIAGSGVAGIHSANIATTTMGCTRA